MAKKKLDNLSKSVIAIMKVILTNKNVMQLVVRDNDKPFEKNVTDEELLKVGNPLDKENGRVLPFPFSPFASTKEQTTIRAYFPTGKLDSSSVWRDTDIIIDIVVARGIWLIENEVREHEIRPYRIMSELVTLLDKEAVDPMGKLEFKGFEHLSVNQEFDAIRMFFKFDSIDFISKD